MNFKFVYALVSGESDYYAEQAMVSMHTLRQHNPECFIVLATDDETLRVIERHGLKIMDYVSECVTINSPNGFTPLQRSRYVKTLIRRCIEGDFLYLDCDTVILGSLKELEHFSGDVAGTLFRHVRHWEKGKLPDRLIEFYDITKIKENLDFEFYCNGGVIYCKDNEKGHRLFDAWHNCWLESSTKYGYDFDQMNLWRANVLSGNIMTELPGEYNCQMIYSSRVMEYVLDCKVFHYQTFSIHCPFLPFKNPEVLNRIRQNGITPDIEDAVRNMMKNYLKNILVLDGMDEIIYNSPVVIFARKISRRLKWTNSVVRFMYRLFGYKI